MSCFFPSPIVNDKEDLDGIPLNDSGKPKAGFKMAPSKWESVDTALLEDQAMTTSKWELLEREEEDRREKERYVMMLYFVSPRERP